MLPGSVMKLNIVLLYWCRISSIAFNQTSVTFSCSALRISATSCRRRSWSVTVYQGRKSTTVIPPITQCIVEPQRKMNYALVVGKVCEYIQEISALVVLPLFFCRINEVLASRRATSLLSANMLIL